MGLEFMDDYILELILALFIAGLTWGFRSWATTIKESTERIMRRLDVVGIDVHNHRIESTEAFARLDERVKALENRHLPN